MLPSAPFVVSCVLSVVLMSYASNPLGSWMMGCRISFRLPVPLTTTRMVTGSPAFTSFLFSWAERLKWPTPPENSVGRAGKGRTLTVSPGATMFFLMFVVPPSIPKASNGLKPLDSWIMPWKVSRSSEGTLHIHSR